MGAMWNSDISRSLTKIAPGPGRIFKKKPDSGWKTLLPKENTVLGRPWYSSSRPSTTASKVRANAALTKLAQIETKIRNRKVRVDLSDAESEDWLPSRAEETPPGGRLTLLHRTQDNRPRNRPLKFLSLRHDAEWEGLGF